MLKSFLSIVKTVNVNITFNILSKSSSEFFLLLSFFCFFFEILMHKNVLIFSVKILFADLSVLLIKILICENCFILIMIDLNIMLLSQSADSDLWIESILIADNFNEILNIEKSVLLIFKINFKLIAFFYNYLIDFCFSKILSICLCRLNSTLFFFSFSANLTV